MLGQQPLGGQPFGQLEPDVERPLADRAQRQRLEHAVTAGLVARAALLDRVLRAGQRGDPGLLHAAEDAGPVVVWSRLIRSTISALPTTNPRRQPAIPYDFDIEKSSTPTSFAPGVARKLSRRAAVEDEVAVGEVVDDERRRVGDRRGEHALGRARRRTGSRGSSGR